jgi:hypothetical protein
MSSEHDLERTVRAWLSDGLESLPDRYLDAALEEISTTNQRRRGALAWRPSEMNMFARFGLAAAAVSLIAVVAWVALSSGSTQVGTEPTPTATPSSTASAGAATTTRSVSSFAVPLTFTAPSDWVIGDGGAYINRLQTLAHWGVNWYSDVRVLIDPCDPGKGLTEPSETATASGLANALKALPGFNMTDPVGYHSPGHSGVQVDMQFTGAGLPCASAGNVPFAQMAGGQRDVINTGYQLRWFITEVHGKVIVIEEWVAGTPLADVSNQLQPIVDSITFH